MASDQASDEASAWAYHHHPWDAGSQEAAEVASVEEWGRVRLLERMARTPAVRRNRLAALAEDSACGGCPYRST